MTKNFIGDSIKPLCMNKSINELIIEKKNNNNFIIHVYWDFFCCLPAEFIYEALTNLKIVWVTNGFLLKPGSLGNSCNN